MEETAFTESITYNPNDFWIIDTDYGYDDRIALSFILKKLNVIAITLCQSSPKKDMPALKEKVIRDLERIGKKNIQVFLGADRPYIDYVVDLKDDEIIDPYNYKKEQNLEFKETDKNGFSNAHSNGNDQTNGAVVQNVTEILSNIAAVKILELIQLYGKKLNILCLGPLTNISLAIILDTSIRYLFNKLYIVGGSVFNFGNSGNCSEYNFRCDPVAAKNVIMNYKNIHLLSLEVDLFLREHRNFLLAFIDEIKNLENKNNQNLIVDYSEFLENFRLIYEKDEEDKEFYHSLFGFTAAVLLLYPELIVKDKIKVLPCDVDIFGRKTRGALMIQNYEHLKNGKFNDVSIISDVDLQDYLNALRKLLTGEEN